MSIETPLKRTFAAPTSEDGFRVTISLSASQIGFLAAMQALVESETHIMPGCLCIAGPSPLRNG